MKRILVAAAAALAMNLGVARAEVRNADDRGFEIVREIAVSASADLAWKALLRVDGWWADAHTYSGRADRLSLAARPGGCWCERLDGGGFVEHMRVIHVRPGKLLRLSGGLGPLQEIAGSGVLTFRVEPDPSGGARVSAFYATDGRRVGGMAALAAPVDAVLGEQLASLCRKLGCRT